MEAHKAVLAAHPMYANLMERALAKVVLQHVTTLEKFCQVNILQLTGNTRLRHAASRRVVFPFLAVPAEASASCLSVKSYECIIWNALRTLFFVVFGLYCTILACQCHSQHEGTWLLCKPPHFILSTMMAQCLKPH